MYELLYGWYDFLHYTRLILSNKTLKFILDNTCIEPIAKPQTHQTNIESTTPTEKFESCCNAKRDKRDATCCSKLNMSRNVNKGTDVPIMKAESGNQPTRYVIN